MKDAEIMDLRLWRIADDKMVICGFFVAKIEDLAKSEKQDQVFSRVSEVAKCTTRTTYHHKMIKITSMQSEHNHDDKNFLTLILSSHIP